MSDSSARFFAAVFRSIGINASATPKSNEDTLELGGLYTSGEECYPNKITMGDFLRIVHTDGFDPSQHAFFMPTANGPCRFGQYAPYLRTVLDKLGHTSVPIISPTSENGYDGLGDHDTSMVLNLWRGMVCGDVLRKMLLKTRPYETLKGAADEANEQSMQLVEAVLSQPGLPAKVRCTRLIEAMGKARQLFHEVPACYTRNKPLIGVVGEIFCRLNDFSNYDAIRKIEEHGGECWLSDISEWVWYTNWSQKSNLRREKKGISVEMLKAVIKNKFQ
jgi:predicted nucleotide-binding protein (sugar kinase/HSP70/actin superfamily)